MIMNNDDERDHAEEAGQRAFTEREEREEWEDEANRDAKFHQVGRELGAEGLPAVEVAGVLVFAYVRDGKLIVSVDLDTPDPQLMPSRDANGDGLVPMEITIQGKPVFTTDAEGHEISVKNCKCCTDNECECEGTQLQDEGILAS
jgi:hypothetical protein